MKFEMNGFDELGKKLNQMQRAAKEMEKGEEVSFDVLFNQSFMLKHTQFNSFDELLEAGNFVVNSPEDFEAIPDDEFDKHIAKTTQFDNWEDMKTTAATDYAAKKLGF
ncbi:hypothetical protein M3638_02860 [Oceanobacillus profundus]|uniref:hypothetical protein n=1 Tax=Oceanobacillus profundus TaxID=372463 RepID=UPI00203ADE4D|nr:hypothetical protein [Oceanobacillus profundus]MCM3396779.1 hypothetical protein [Oceanobacillus profundus]